MKNISCRFQIVLVLLLLTLLLAIKTVSVESHRQTGDVNTTEHFSEETKTTISGCAEESFDATVAAPPKINEDSAKRKEIFIGILPSQINIFALP